VFIYGPRKVACGGSGFDGSITGFLDDLNNRNHVIPTDAIEYNPAQYIP
jgi:hypothetical protein